MNNKLVPINNGQLAFHLVGEGRDVLFVHGFPLDHSSWSGQYEAAVDVLSNLRMLVPDLPGFGKSTVDVGPALTMARMADDLATGLDELGVNQPIAVCGLSMGGYIALEFWNRHPERLSHLILCDTRSATDTTVTAKGRLIAAERALAEGTEFLVGSMLPKLISEHTLQNQSELVASLRDVCRSAPPESVAAALRGMAERTDFTNRLSEIQVPALCICGADDVITPAKEMREMADAIPNSRFLEVSLAGHLAPLEQSEVVNQEIADFLGSAR